MLCSFNTRLKTKSGVRLLTSTVNYFIRKNDLKAFIHKRLDWKSINGQWVIALDSDFLFFLFYTEQKEQLHVMARSNNFFVCQQYLINYLEHVKQQIEQYKLKWSQQSTLCPILPVSIWSNWSLFERLCWFIAKLFIKKKSKSTD